MAKIERKYFAHFINIDGYYERLGKDLEEFNTEMSAQVETKKNILGESSILISGYEKTASVEPFYADKDSKLFTRLQVIIDQGSVLDALKTDVVEVKLWEIPEEGVYPAYREEAYIEIVSYGGDTTGYQILFNLHFTGERERGFFSLDTKTFTTTI